MSLADICLFAYTHVADDGEFDLAALSDVVRWIERVKGQPTLHRDGRLTGLAPTAAQVYIAAKPAAP